MLIEMQDGDPWPFVISRIRLRAALLCQQNGGSGLRDLAESLISSSAPPSRAGAFRLRPCEGLSLAYGLGKRSKKSDDAM